MNTWTTERPTKAGQYWMRMVNTTAQAAVCHVDAHGRAWALNDQGKSMLIVPGFGVVEWAPAIPPEIVPKPKLTDEQILEACADARKRVSAMSQWQRDQLLRRGRAIVDGTTYSAWTTDKPDISGTFWAREVGKPDSAQTYFIDNDGEIWPCDCQSTSTYGQQFKHPTEWAEVRPPE